MSRGTKSNLLHELQAAVSGVDFGLREPRNKILISPYTLWERIKQVFTGPRFAIRMGEIEIAVISECVLTDQKRNRIWTVIEGQRPAGIVVTVLEFERLPRNEGHPASCSHLHADGWSG